jgi:hypothetical protein
MNDQPNAQGSADAAGQQSTGNQSGDKEVTDVDFEEVK